MARKLISSGSSFEEDIGYSRAVVAGDWILVSGTTGFDYSTMTISDSLIEQTEQCLMNIESALLQAGSSLREVVRVTCVLPNGAEFAQCWQVQSSRSVTCDAMRHQRLIECQQLKGPNWRCRPGAASRSSRSIVWEQSLNLNVCHV